MYKRQDEDITTDIDELGRRIAERLAKFNAGRSTPVEVWFCLLYTSDAADERSSVDLGGRRIIKKKKSGVLCCFRRYVGRER